MELFGRNNSKPILKVDTLAAFYANKKTIELPPIRILPATDIFRLIKFSGKLSTYIAMTSFFIFQVILV